MTIYTRADSNIRKTWLLLGLFLILLLLLGGVFSYTFKNPAILIFALILTIAAGISSYWYSDKIVLAMTWAKPIDHRQNPELYHLLENLTIAAGLPLPKFYLMEESQPNAFAVGKNPQHAAIVVTRGLVDKLDKSELEGVLGHELSHIGNRDALLMMVVVVLVAAVANLSEFFLRWNSWGQRDDDNNRSNFIMFLITIAAAVLAWLAATLIQFAISKQREFLADASSALLTRYPEGLARALEKIAADSSPLRVANNSTAHLYIVNPFKGRQTANWLFKLFSTHPPIQDRIKALREMSV